MNIWIGGQYKVNITDAGSYLNEEGDFIDDVSRNTTTVEGGKLLEMITSLLMSRELFEFTASDNKFTFEFYRNTGECSTSIWEIKEITDEGF